MKRVSLFILLLAFGVCNLTGCSRLVGEGMEEVRGAKGLYAPIRGLAPDSQARPLGRYRRFELGQISDDFGGNVPAGLWDYLREAFADQLAKKRLPNDPAGKTLLVRGKILHYEDAGMLGHAMGPLEQVIARIELVDKDSGAVIGVANCVGRTTKSVGTGVKKKAEGLAKAIVAWIDARYPLEGREEE